MSEREKEAKESLDKCRPFMRLKPGQRNPAGDLCSKQGTDYYRSNPTPQANPPSPPPQP